MWFASNALHQMQCLSMAAGVFDAKCQGDQGGTLEHLPSGSKRAML
jgi:hypothetical protein